MVSVLRAKKILSLTSLASVLLTTLFKDVLPMGLQDVSFVGLPTEFRILNVPKWTMAALREIKTNAINVDTELLQ